MSKPDRCISTSRDDIVRVLSKRDVVMQLMQRAVFSAAYGVEWYHDTSLIPIHNVNVYTDDSVEIDTRVDDYDRVEARYARDVIFYMTHGQMHSIESRILCQLAIIARVPVTAQRTIVQAVYTQRTLDALNILLESFNAENFVRPRRFLPDVYAIYHDATQTIRFYLSHAICDAKRLADLTATLTLHGICAVSINDASALRNDIRQVVTGEAMTPDYTIFSDNVPPPYAGI